MHTLGPSATDIQSHLYNSFITASTHDVAIRVEGSWTAVYKLHRVVLIQSGFFRSLFTAGFLESKSSRSRNGPDEITVVFDDFNITRPAFEICISRLYGGGPLLHVSPNLIPTTNYPLSPPFAGILESEDVPPGKQHATPRFLVSLLATAIYLSIPSVASQALSLVLKTVGPTTVLQYLDFACGKSLCYSNPIPEEHQPAVGLENVAFILEDTDTPTATISIEGLKSQPSIDSDSSEPSTGDGDPPESSEVEADDHGPSYHYGAVSDKVGEACTCWLARWAVDMLEMEDQRLNVVESRLRAMSVSSIDKVKTISLSSASTATLANVPKSPVIWGRGGLSARWVATLISADTLFVTNERERYNFARSVVELRRRDGILGDEELIWTGLFEHGIHYSNMTFDDILFISQDISPTTQRLFVPLSALQSAHWSQALLRHQITSNPRPTNSNSPIIGSSSPTRDKELGLILTTADLLASLPETSKKDGAGLKKSYHPVFTDQSLRIGDGGGATLSMEELFDPSQHPVPKPRTSTTTTQETTPLGKIQTTEDKFFGLLTPRLTAQDCVDMDPTGKMRWTPHPPFRFSVEFWDVDLLKEKSRLHSQTIWYAGSLFNIYVQLVRKKGTAQLGIYLHRQSHVDPIPSSSAPPTSPGDRNFRQPSTASLVQTIPPSPFIPNHYSPSIHPLTRTTTPAAPRNGTPPSPPSPSSSPPISSPLGYGPMPSTLLNPAPLQVYRDPRSAISAYFSVSCASATGSSQTRFSSSPDTFTVGQSWGWKSSTLRTEEFLEVGTQTLPENMMRGKEVSLRATVVVGLV